MDKDNSRCNAAQSAGMVSPIWLIGWLFTIGYAGLSFWQAVLGLIIWPWFLGSSLR